MKHFSPAPRKLLSLFLAAATAAALTVSPLAAVIGTELFSYSSEVHQGTTLSHGVYWGSSANDKRTENYISYTPSSAVTPIITYGSKVTSTSTLSSAAKTLEAQGYRVVAGINGDYYYTSSGIPMGLLVTDGIIRSGYNYTWAIGFMEDGSVIMGDPKLSVKMSYTHTVTETVSVDTGEDGDSADTAAENGTTSGDGASQTVTREETVTKSIYTINKARDNSGIFLYTNDFNAKGTTGCTEAGVDVVLVPADGSDNADLRIGQTLTLTVESVTAKTGATDVPAGKIVLSVNNNASAENVKALSDLKAGDTVTITTAAASSQWRQAKYITSGYLKLIENGTISSSLGSTGAPRTAIGLKDDGTVIFYTIDGRQSGYSVGASESLLAQRLLQLGCTTAVCLDGGGSTTLTATLPDSSSASVLNQPSGGSERAVSTQIFLVASGTATGTLDHYYISPLSTKLLAGATQQLHYTAVDSAYYPISTDSGASWSTSSGSITQGGLFTAPTQSGVSTVTVSDGTKSASMSIETVANPDSLVARANGSVLSSLSVKAGDSVTLTMSAVSNHMTLISQNRCFQFSVSGDIGTITSNGVFTATKDGTGFIQIKAGTASLTIPVTVQSLPFTDVALSSWYYDAVEYVYEAGLMNGTGGTLFEPSGTTSRSMIVQVLYNKEGKPESTYTGAFSDVAEGKWYTAAVEWAAANGIVSGTGAGAFEPNGNITREQMAAILYRYAAYAGLDTTTRGDVSAFSDSAKIDAWAADAMAWAVGTGLFKGSDGKLNPLATATRAEVAQVLTNFDAIFSAS